MTPPRPAIRAVLVNYHCADHIEQRLASGVFESLDEVLIVDNASDPERVAGWKSAYGVTPVLLPGNVGFAAAVNEAVRRSTSSGPILLLNPDADLDRRGLRRLLRELAGADAGADAVAPLLRDTGGGVQVGAGGGPLTLRSVTTYFLFLSHVVPRARGIFLTRRQIARGAAADWLCMACLLLAPDAFERFGPIPEDELVYAEDVAWGTRATRRGARFRLVPEVSVEHEQGVSGGGDAWVGALERLYLRRLGALRGRVAVGVMRVGLAVREVRRALR
ncbi:MAG TPA: glycosyltransferase [Actinomycetes bacterium]|nr:glycosyltransferase [Actinomycetes bacterium]